MALGKARIDTTPQIVREFVENFNTMNGKALDAMMSLGAAVKLPEEAVYREVDAKFFANYFNDLNDRGQQVFLQVNNDIDTAQLNKTTEFHDISGRIINQKVGEENLTDQMVFISLRASFTVAGDSKIVQLAITPVKERPRDNAPGLAA